MASAKAHNKGPVAAVSLPECPVCLETMSAPIFQCQSGHSLCNNCTESLHPPVCPICRVPMTQMRNWQLEDIVLKAKVQCPNKSIGCVYTLIAAEVDDHLKECIFRDMECPLGSVFGKCSWHGKINEMIDHFKDRHPANCNVSSDADVVLDNIRLEEDDRFFYLVPQGKLLFMLTFKIDTLQKMAYWTIQHIGSKKGASQHVYEINVISNQDQRRKIMFTEQCVNDSMKADDIFRTGKCAMLPLDVLKHFIQNKKLNFRFAIKKMPPVNKGNEKKGNENQDDNCSQNKGPTGRQSSKGYQGQKGPQGPKGPKGPHQKWKNNKQQ